MRLESGKYIGHAVGEVPTEYLEWALGHLSMTGAVGARRAGADPSGGQARLVTRGTRETTMRTRSESSFREAAAPVRAAGCHGRGKPAPSSPYPGGVTAAQMEQGIRDISSNPWMTPLQKTQAISVPRSRFKIIPE